MNYETSAIELKQKTILNGKFYTCLQLIDEKDLAFGSSDHKIRIFEVSSLKRKVILNGHVGDVIGIQKVSNVLISCDNQKTVRVWALNDNYSCIKSYSLKNLPDQLIKGYEIFMNFVELIVFEFQVMLVDFTTQKKLWAYDSLNEQIDQVRFLEFPFKLIIQTNQQIKVLNLYWS